MSYATITSYPGLSQLTVIPSSQKEIVFTVLIEWSKYRPDYPYELAVCYSQDASKHSSTWTSLPLTKTESPAIVDAEDNFRSAYSAQILRKSFATNKPISFTVKYRISSRSPWLWVETEQGSSPGQVLFAQDQDVDKVELQDVLQLSSDWTAKPVSSPTSPSTFYLESKTMIPHSAKLADDAQMDLHPLVLGRVDSMQQSMAITRLEPYWLGARQGGSYFHLSEEALAVSLLLDSGLVLTIITVTGIDDVYSVIQSSSLGEVAIAARSDGDRTVPYHAIASISNSIESGLEACMNHARSLVNQLPYIQALATVEKGAAPDGKAPRTSTVEWLDSLAFCTWNALGQDLNENKILSALDDLAKNKIYVSTLLIDDNWQTLQALKGTEERGHAALTANTKVAPDGLETLISNIRKGHPRIRDIGVWHALLGYWGGIAPNSEITRQYETMDIHGYLMGHVPWPLHVVAPSSVHKWYDDFYRYLAGSGCTFVKTDVQHMLSMFRMSDHRKAAIPAIQSAWTQGYNTHFAGKAISCMSQTPYTLYGSLLQTHSPPILLRNSDDFYPEVLPSHPWHIWVNGHNALFTRNLNVVLDWDMFQTDHSYSAYHAAARCISGGPILITDTPGHHDVSLIKRMTSLSTDGRNIALRPHAGRSIRGFDSYKNGPGVCKIGTTTDTGASLLGVWNIADFAVTTLLPLSEFIIPDKQDKWTCKQIVVRGCKTGQIFGPFDTSTISAADTSTLVYIKLEVREWDIFSAVPVLDVGGAQVAVLGLTGHMTGIAGLTGVHVDGRKISVRSKAVDVFEVWVADATETVKVKVQDESVQHEMVKKEGSPGALIRVDLEKAWDARSLWDKGEKEVKIEIEL